MIVAVEFVLMVLCIAIAVVIAFVEYANFPLIKARKIKEAEMKEIHNGYLAHRTSKVCVEKILEEKCLRSSKGFLKTYSLGGKRAVYFFVSAFFNKKAERFNYSSKFECEIRISNLTDEQIENLRLRRLDKAVAHIGDFEFLPQNVVTVVELEKPSKTHLCFDLFKEVFSVNGVLFASLLITNIFIVVTVLTFISAMVVTL